MTPQLIQTARQQAMQQAWEAYNGALPDPLTVKPSDINDNVKSNRCRPIVDKGVSFLFGQVLKITSDQSAGEDAQACLDGCWGHDDNRMTMLAKLAKHGGICGHAFVKIIPPDADGDPCRLVVLDPMNMDIITAPEDIDTVLGYTITYATRDPIDNTPTQKRQTITRVDPDDDAASGAYDTDSTWIIQDSILRGGQWVPLADAQVWDYPFPPVADCQNLVNSADHWGTPDLTPDLIAMNRALNFIQSNTNRIIKNHAHPYVWGVGFRAADMEMTPGKVIVLPGQSSKLEALQAYGDVGQCMAFADDLRSDMDEQSRVPAVALGRLKDLPRGTISGVALQLLFQPLIEKTIEKQRLYGDLIRDISKRMLAICGYNYDTNIELHWQNLLPVDDLAAAQTAMILSQLGVSTDTILSQLGYNPDVESEKTQVEAAKQAVNFTRGQGVPPADGQEPPVAPAGSPFMGRT